MPRLQPTISLATIFLLYCCVVKVTVSFVVVQRGSPGRIVVPRRSQHDHDPTEFGRPPPPRGRSLLLHATRQSSSNKVDKEEEDDIPWYDNLDILQGNGDDEGGFLYDDDTFEDWIPDANKATKKPTHLTPAKEVMGKGTAEKKDTTNVDASGAGSRKSPYTDEEEELIEAMGGRNLNKQSKREEGFLGDSTLKEIATDYSVPICYLADVLCMWKVPVPINIHDRLGDLVTGEQAFALVEAIHTLDMGALNDRYSNLNLLQICSGWNIDINEAFQFAMKEGWSLPFGVRTNLRVEQEDELLRVFSSMYQDDDDDDF